MLELKDILKKDAAWKASGYRESVTIDDLLVSGTILEASGYSYDMIDRKKVAVNYTNIQSFLIKEAGSLCDFYASDLLFNLKEVDELLHQTETDFHKRIAFGFRKSGVDGNKFTLSRLSQPNMYGSITNEYRALYVLDIDMNHMEENGLPEVKMTLSLVFKIIPDYKIRYYYITGPNKGNVKSEQYFWNIGDLCHTYEATFELGLGAANPTVWEWKDNDYHRLTSAELFKKKERCK